MPIDIFEAVRSISSIDAAERAGLAVKRRGEHAWACCPFHGEKTASLCLYREPERGWVCYGCHKGGDAVALYAGLYNLSLIDAAKQLAADFGIDVPQDAGRTFRPAERTPTKYHMRRALEKIISREYDRCCLILHAAEDILCNDWDKDSAWDDPAFLSALRARAKADMMLDRLLSSSTEEAIEYCKRGDDKR